MTPSPLPPDPAPLDPHSRALRLAIVAAFASAGRGHLGSAFSLVEILRVLYDDILRFDPARPRWEGRDRMDASGFTCPALARIVPSMPLLSATRLA